MNEEEIKEEAIHPADVADQLERLPVEEAQQELRDLPAREGAAVLAEMEKDRWPSFLETLGPAEIARLLKELPHNEAADVLSTLDESISKGKS